MSETDLLKTIMGALAWDRGCMFIRVNSGLRLIDGKGGKKRAFRGAPTGTSDLIGMVDGRFCALEVKRPGCKPTNAQAAFLDHVRQLGGFGAVVTSVTEAQLAVNRAREGAGQ